MKALLAVILTLSVAYAARDVLLAVPFNPWVSHNKVVYKIEPLYKTVTKVSDFPEVGGVQSSILNERDHTYTILGMSVQYKPIQIVFNSTTGKRLGQYQFPYTPNDPQNARLDSYRRQALVVDVLARKIWNFDLKQTTFDEVVAWEVPDGEKTKPDPKVTLYASDSSAINSMISMFYTQMRNETTGVTYLVGINYREKTIEKMLPIEQATKGWFVDNNMNLWAFSTSGHLGKFDLNTGKWQPEFEIGHLPWLESVTYSPKSNTVYIAYMSGAKYFVSGYDVATGRETVVVPLPESVCYLRADWQ
ncbi:hypothetical protein RCL1_004742 [Eukaryota sp. TZLM3-RCL]